ncbi:MAG TPA: glycoside hydrolase family 27 protein [Ruania sp.]|nr:glycoside hydrolase family 27 protein [Ruania sp.]
MGWNSWDCYGTTVTEAEVLENAQVLAERLLPSGWDTVVVDIQWYEPTARAGGYNTDAPISYDEDGVQQPALARFPSAAEGAGFAPLAARVHELGLRFGLHLMRGIPRRVVAADLPVRDEAGTVVATTAEIADPASTCSWNSDNVGLDLTHPGAQVWLDRQIERIVGWGVDFLKVDDMLAPYHADAIEALHRAVTRAEERHGHQVLVSLSPGTDLSLAHLGHLRAHADMWRISDDLWDRWQDVHAQLGRLARWAPHQGPDGWADADMLPLGRIGIRAERGQPRHSLLTADERRTLLSLWCLGRSPMFVGGDLPSSDQDTLADLARTDVLAVGRHSTGNAELLREGDLVLWGARGTGPEQGTAWAGVFSTADEPLRHRVPLASTGLDPATDITEVWSGRSVRPDGAGDLLLDLPPHGVALLRTR